MIDGRLEIAEFLGTSDTGYDLCYGIQRNKYEGFKFVEEHSTWGGGEGEREVGPLFKRLSDGTFWWLSYEFDSYGSYMDYMTLQEMHQVEKVVWETK